MSKKTFLKEFIREKKTVGSITPSSRFLASKMIENLDFSSVKVVVEIGPGTGVFTRKILKKIPDHVLFLVLELNEEFYEKLNAELIQNNVKIKHDSAENLQSHLNDLGFENADIIISSLPLSNMGDHVRNLILKTITDSLKPEGKFIQFQYSLQAKKELKNWFSQVSIKFTALNIPPAFVYTCIK
jgi:phospholipid N-methyltransferase